MRRIHVQINVYDFLVELVQFRNFLYQLEERRLCLATWINAFQVPTQEVIIGILQKLHETKCFPTPNSEKPFGWGLCAASAKVKSLVPSPPVDSPVLT